MGHKFHIVLTTINMPSVIEDLLENTKQHNHIDETKIWVIGDIQTPEETRDLCQTVSEQGLETIYLDIAEQNNIGKNFIEFYDRLPLANESRRNVGFIAAYQDGAEILISMDDDNFPLKTISSEDIALSVLTASRMFYRTRQVIIIFVNT